MTWPKVGTRVHVEWLDPTIHTMCPVADAKPAKCWTEGTIVKKTPVYVVVAASQYEDGDGDFTVLVKGSCTNITRMI